MRGGVSLAVPVLPALPGHCPFQGRRHVLADVGIRSFLDGDRRGRMRNEDVQKPIPPSVSGDRLLQ